MDTRSTAMVLELGVGAGTGELHICSVDGEVAACLDMQEREASIEAA